jgi:hypothetical protein
MLGDAPENRRKMGSRERAPRCSTALESAENDGGACGLRRVIATAWQRFSREKRGGNGEGKEGNKGASSQGS